MKKTPFSLRACLSALARVLLLALPFASTAETGGPMPPGLRQLLVETLETSPRVQSARAALEAAQARLRAAAQPLYNPELELEAERAETRSATLGISQSIDWADKRSARTRMAERLLDAARSEYAEARRTLAGALLTALARYHTARSLDRLAAQRQALMQRFLELARKRHAAGDLNRVELDLARLAFTQVQLQRSQTASELAQAEQELVALVGASRPDWPQLPLDLPPLGELDVDRLLERLPAIRSARARVEAAREEVRLRRRERRPDPTLGIRAGKEQAFRGADESFGVVGLTLQLPLFVRNDFRAEVEVAEAGLTRALRELEDALREARARLLAAAERYRLERRAWQVWVDAGEASLESQLALLERFWRVGELSSADYLVQLNQTIDTRVAAREVRGRLWSAWAAWLRESGQIQSLFAGPAGAER